MTPAPDPSLLAGAWLTAALVLGACFGSFANVLIHRLPRDESVAGPGSRCPACGHPIRWHDNVPVLGWLLLRGRCRDCRAAISPRYPLVELAGAAAGAAALWRWGPTPAGLGGLLFLVALLAIALIDWEHMIIPHTLTVGGMVVGLLLAPWSGRGLTSALAGGLLGAGLVLALSYGYRLVRGQIGMGGGDVMLMGMVGVFLGPWGALLVLFGGALLGAVFAVVRYGSSLSGKSRLPFGTFLAAAAALAGLAGEAAIGWYLGTWR